MTAQPTPYRADSLWFEAVELLLCSVMQYINPQYRLKMRLLSYTSEHCFLFMLSHIAIREKK